MSGSKPITNVADVTVNSTPATISAAVNQYFSSTLSANGTITIFSALDTTLTGGSSILNDTGLTLSGAIHFHFPGGGFNPSTGTFNSEAPGIVGVYLGGNSETFTNAGSVSSDVAIYTNYTTMTGVYNVALGDVGVSGSSFDLINEASASIYGVAGGVDLFGHGSVSNAGSITSNSTMGGDGVFVQEVNSAASQFSTVSNSGFISGNLGINGYGYVAVSNSISGRVVGSFSGIYDVGNSLYNTGSIPIAGRLDLTNDGLISGGTGVVLQAGSILNGSAGSIRAATVGVSERYRNNGTGPAPAYIPINNGGTIVGGIGVEIATGTVDNAGLIEWSNSSFGVGVRIANGSLTNTGNIEAAASLQVPAPGTNLFQTAVDVGFSSIISGHTFSTPSGVSNMGIILGGGVDDGIRLQNGTFLNSGTVEAGAVGAGSISYGIGLDANHVTGSNNGLIAGGYGASKGGSGAALAYGSFLNTGKIVGGSAGTAGAGGAGVYINVGTFENAGTVVGGMANGTLGDAVSMSSTQPDGQGVSVIVDPGAVFQGTVLADIPPPGHGGIATLDLAGTTASTLSGFGSQFLNFDELVFNPGATWTVEALLSGIDGAVQTSGFTLGDALVLQGESITSLRYVSGANEVALTIGSTQDVIQVINGTYAGDQFVSSFADGNSTITLEPIACFAEGTRILTPKGEIAVEDIGIGDEVVVHGGGTASIKWIGYRRMSLEQHSSPNLARPVMISADAICDGVPRADLFVSPDHGLYLGGCLIAAKDLLNGHTIRQTAWAEVTYFHIELETHGVIYANGTPAETYLDTGNRASFENNEVSNVIDLHPDFGAGGRERFSCAPFLTHGPLVESVRSGLLARASIPTTDDPDLQIITSQNGETIISSRAGQPGYLTPDPRDKRLLGVKIGAITIGGRQIALDDPALTEGWYDAEPDGRWTNGHAVIPSKLKLHPDESVEVAIVGTTLYRDARYNMIATTA